MTRATCKVGSFVLRTTTGTQDVTVEAGFGAPVALEIWCSDVELTGEGDDGEIVHAQFSFGMTDEAENVCMLNTWARDNAATSNTAKAGRSTTVLELHNTQFGAGNVLVVADMSARVDWPTDGFQVNVTTTNGSDVIVNYRAWGGGCNSQLDQVSVGATPLNVSTSWEAQVWIAAMTGEIGGASNGGFMSLGFAAFDGASTFQNACATWESDDNQANATDAASSWNNALMCSHTVSAVSNRTTVTASSSSQYTLTRQEGASTRAFFVLALTFDAAPLRAVGNYETPTSTGTAAVTVGFEPMTLSFVSSLIETAQVNSVVATGGEVVGLGYGAASWNSASSAERAASIRDQDAAATTDNGSWTGAHTASQLSNTGALYSEAEFDSATNTTIVFNWTTTGNTTALRFPYLAVELHALRSLASTAPAVSGEQAALGVIRGIAATDAAVSGESADMVLDLTLSAEALAVSDETADLILNMVLASTAPALSDESANLVIPSVEPGPLVARAASFSAEGRGRGASVAATARRAGRRGSGASALTVGQAREARKR